jgi:hypothetical protein
LPNKHEALTSDPRTAPQKEKKKKTLRQCQVCWYTTVRVSGRRIASLRPVWEMGDKSSTQLKLFLSSPDKAEKMIARDETRN